MRRSHATVEPRGSMHARRTQSGARCAAPRLRTFEGAVLDVDHVSVLPEREREALHHLPRPAHVERLERRPDVVVLDHRGVEHAALLQEVLAGPGQRLRAGVKVGQLGQVVPLVGPVGAVRRVPRL